MPAASENGSKRSNRREGLRAERRRGGRYRGTGLSTPRRAPSPSVRGWAVVDLGAGYGVSAEGDIDDLAQLEH